MRWFTLAALPLWVGAVAEGQKEKPKPVPVPVSDSYIVEYAPGAPRTHRNFAAATGVKVVKQYSSDVFSGASVQTSNHNVDSLSKLPGVINVWVNAQVPLAKTLSIFDPADAAASANYTTHNATGVSKLHDMGIYGKGVKVGIVDTGTWYKHPALGGCFGQGCKVAGGYDLVGDGLWPSEPKAPDSDPIDTAGHGTHVSGIIAGKSNYWQGVAPEAELYSYKVFSYGGSTDTETLIDAFLMAYKDGCDVITASVGGASGWSTEPWAVVASRLVDQGVIVTISAGNDGVNGPFFASSGSSGSNVLAIASVGAQNLPSTPFQAIFSSNSTNHTVDIGYLPAAGYFPTTVVGWEIQPMSLTELDDEACQPYPQGTAKLTNKIPLVRRARCDWSVQQANLNALGAQYILIYNNDSPLVSPSTSNYTSSIAAIEARSGKAIVAAVKAEQKVTANFSSNPEAVVSLPYPAGGLPTDFSSWGGTNDLFIKPQIAAPGGDIYSTWLNDAYKIMSGTSMACPYVAGVAALYISAIGGRDIHGPDFAKTFRLRTISSGRALPWATNSTANYNHVASVAQMGTGLVDAYKILNYTTSLAFDNMALNDTAHFSRYHHITVSNKGTGDVAYSFSLQPAAGVNAMGFFPEGKRLNALSELTPSEMTPDITLPGKFTLKPGQSKTVPVNFLAVENKGWNATILPLYSGKILVSGNNGELLSVPYMGLASDLKKQLSSVYQDGYPQSYSLTNKTSIAEKNWYAMDLSGDVQDFPRIVVKNIWGSKEVRWDIYVRNWTERQWKYPPVPGQNGYIGTVATWFESGSVDVFYPEYYNASQTINYPLTNEERNAPPVTGATDVTHEFWWFGKLGNGSQINNGHYKMRFAMLKPFAGGQHSEDWDIFEAPTIEIRGKYSQE